MFHLYKVQLLLILSVRIPVVFNSYRNSSISMPLASNVRAASDTVRVCAFNKSMISATSSGSDLEDGQWTMAIK